YLAQRLDAAPVLDQIELQLHLLASLGDGLQHAWKKTRAIDQQGEAVAAAPGKYRTVAHQRATKISTAPTGTAWLMARTLASSRNTSTPSARPKSPACRVTGASVTTWKRFSSKRVTNSSARWVRPWPCNLAPSGRRNSSGPPGASWAIVFKDTRASMLAKG